MLIMPLENLVLVGIILLIIGLIIIIVGSLQSGNAKVGIGGFIGPFPFGFANDQRMLQLVIILTIVIAAIFFLFALR